MRPIKNWFSNFEPLDKPFEFCGMTFETIETFYQCMKIPPTIKYRKLREMVSLMKPGAAKRFCSRREKNFPLRKDWEHVKVQIMHYALRKKFAQGTSWRQKLDETTGDIVEWNNWHDNIWGSCTCPYCRGKRGQNLLGKLLMGIRDEKTK